MFTSHVYNNLKRDYLMDNNQYQPIAPQPGQAIPPNAPPPAPIPPQPPQKKKTGLWIALGVGAVVLIVGIVVAVVLLKSTQKSSPSPSASAKPQASNDNLTTDTVMSKINDHFASSYKLVQLGANDTSNIQKGELGMRSSKTPPFYKVDGYDYYNDYDGGSSVTIETYAEPSSSTASYPLPADTSVRKEVAGVYTDLGLVKKDSPVFEVDTYTGHGLICTITTSSAEGSVNDARCGAIDSYADMAKKLKPFADVLPDINDNTVLLNLKVSNSTTAGYQKASVMVGDVGASAGGSNTLFYKPDGGKWTYFMNGANGPTDCSAYNTPDLRKAFAGDECVSQGSMSTVK